MAKQKQQTKVILNEFK